MPCGCHQNKSALTQGDLSRGAGGYLSTYYGDDGVRYSGPEETTTVYCVGRQTTHERMFTDFVEASAYSQQVRKTLIHQDAANFPNEAMTVLFQTVDA